jgi:hypothetical protein
VPALPSPKNTEERDPAAFAGGAEPAQPCSVGPAWTCAELASAMGDAPGAATAPLSAFDYGVRVGGGGGGIYLKYKSFACACNNGLSCLLKTHSLSTRLPSALHPPSSACASIPACLDFAPAGGITSTCWQAAVAACRTSLQQQHVLH